MAKMGIRIFWKIIKMLDWSCTGDDGAVLAPAIEHLSCLHDKDIFDFEDILAKLLYDLDSREIALELYRSDKMISDDRFLYQRCVAVANGQGYYSSILYRGRKLDPDLDFEPLLYLPKSAWAKKHGKDVCEYPHTPNPSYETGSNRALWKKRFFPF